MIKMDFVAELSTLDQIMLYIRHEAIKYGMHEKVLPKVELACEEAIVNIISYAYPKKKGQLTVECQKKGSRFEIILKDQGIAFNPIDAELNPQVDRPMNERRIGGLGIFLLRKTIDEASYQRQSDENILRLAFCMDVVTN